MLSALPEQAQHTGDDEIDGDDEVEQLGPEQDQSVA